jgi:lipopolysaccharide transport system ATP-binding protein
MNPTQHDSDEIAIQVNNVSKCYQIYEKPADRLKQFCIPRIRRNIGLSPKQYFREFWALRDVSFEVKRGEAVGIIGRNGAGKSTLLQMIAGTLTPTSGDIQVNGTVAALLELGSGFNLEFSGRENVYLTASVLGLTQNQIEQRFDEIAVFADIGDFIDQPLNTYSSGMMMRLAFAVNTCVNPDILIVDEALGVGDAPFQSKCFKRLRQLIDDGTSILFVSHDISTVRSICSRALWLKNGHAEMWGEANEVAKEYERFCWQEQGVLLQASEKPSEITAEPVRGTDASNSYDGELIEGPIPRQLFEPNQANEENFIRTRMGTGAVVIKNFLLLNDVGDTVTTCEYNERLKTWCLLEINEPVDSDFVFALRIRDLKGSYICTVSDLVKIHRITGRRGDRFVATMGMSFPFHHQEYVVSLAVFGFRTGNAFLNGVYDFSQSEIWDSIDDAAFVKVLPFKLMPLAGPVHVSSELVIEKLN